MQKNNSDTIYANPLADVSRFAFDQRVVDVFPDMTDSMDSPRGGVRLSSTMPASLQQEAPIPIHQNNPPPSYKQRIRASAGGGMGPNYKMDSR